MASCPSGAIYKREEDGIVLVDQDRCRGWRQCITGCPYKKIYFNHKTRQGREVHVLLPPRRGGPADGLLRDVRRAAALPRPLPLRRRPGHGRGGDPGRGRPLRGAARPAARPERPRGASPRPGATAYRTTGWTPRGGHRSTRWPRSTGSPCRCTRSTARCRWSGTSRRCRRSSTCCRRRATTPRTAACSSAPSRRCASPSTTSPSSSPPGAPTSSRACSASSPRCAPTCATSSLGRDGDPSIPAAVGMSEETLYEMYRLMAIAKYDERYVIPTAHVERAHELEEIGCSLDFDEGPGMYESGPFGEASGRPAPVAVETFNALQAAPDLRDHDVDDGRRASCAAGSTCSTGTARARRPGSSPSDAQGGRAVIGLRRRRAARPATTASCTSSQDGASTTPARSSSPHCPRCVRPWRSTATHRARPSWRVCSTTSVGPIVAAPPAHLRRHLRPQPQACALPVLLDRRGHPPTRRGAGTVQDGIPQQRSRRRHPRGAARLPADGARVRSTGRQPRPAAPSSRTTGRASSCCESLCRRSRVRMPCAVVAVCATLPGESPPDRAAVMEMVGMTGPPRPRPSGWSPTTRGSSRCNRSRRARPREPAA